MRKKMGKGRFLILSLVLVVVAITSYWFMYSSQPSKQFNKHNKNYKSKIFSHKDRNRLQNNGGQRTLYKQRMKEGSINSVQSQRLGTKLGGEGDLQSQRGNLNILQSRIKAQEKKDKMVKYSEGVRKGLYFDDASLGMKHNKTEMTTYPPIKKITVAPKPSWRITDISRFYGGLSTYSNFYKNLQKIVHLDLKGAAPNINYTKELFPWLKEFGATGILIEYEDMFPFENKLEKVRANNAYSKDDIMTINKLAKDNHLDLIPLVQTLSGLDFLLKIEEFQNLREVETNPSVISPALDSSYSVLSSMIEQVMAMHSDAKFIHLGSGGAPGLGDGLSSNRVKAGESPADIYLKHVISVTKLLKKYSIQPLICDSYLRTISPDKLTKSGIGNFVQPVIGVTSSNPAERLPHAIWKNYGVFSKVWVATYFKGESGSSNFLTTASEPLTNLLNWIEILDKQGPGNVDSFNAIKFEGIVVLGRSRYDHFANLCELLPAGIPNLAMSLNTIDNGGFDKNVHAAVTKQLDCSRPVKLEIKISYKEADACRFPGSEVYYMLRKLWTSHKAYRDVMVDVRGIAAPSNFQNQFASPMRLQHLNERLKMLKASMLAMEKPFRKELTKLFDVYTANEWIKTNIKQSVSWISDHIIRMKSFSKKKTWSSRPGYKKLGKLNKTINLDVGMQKEGNLNQNQARPGGNFRPLGGIDGIGKENFNQNKVPSRGNARLGDGMERKDTGKFDQNQIPQGRNDQNIRGMERNARPEIKTDGKLYNKNKVLQGGNDRRPGVQDSKENTNFKRNRDASARGVEMADDYINKIQDSRKPGLQNLLSQDRMLRKQQQLLKKIEADVGLKDKMMKNKISDMDVKYSLKSLNRKQPDVDSDKQNVLPRMNPAKDKRPQGDRQSDAFNKHQPDRGVNLEGGNPADNSNRDLQNRWNKKSNIAYKTLEQSELPDRKVRQGPKNPTNKSRSSMRLLGKDKMQLFDKSLNPDSRKSENSEKEGSLKQRMSPEKMNTNAN